MAMKAAVDIDGVVADQIPPILQIISERFKRIATKDQIIHYSFSDSLGLPPGSDRIIIDEYNRTRLLSAPPIRGALVGLEDLRRLFDIHLVTSRPQSTEQATSSWLAEHGFVFDKIHFIEHALKAEFIATSGFHLAIEDAGDIAVESADKGINTFLMNAPWNQSAEHSRLYRVESWEEIITVANTLV